MDKNIIEKLDYLETLDNLNGCYFYTNFIATKENKILKLLDCKIESFGKYIWTR